LARRTGVAVRSVPDSFSAGHRNAQNVASSQRLKPRSSTDRETLPMPECLDSSRLDRRARGSLTAETLCTGARQCRIARMEIPTAYLNARAGTRAVAGLLDERAWTVPVTCWILCVGVYVCDRAGLVVRYNRAAAELWGCAPKSRSYVRFAAPIAFSALIGHSIRSCESGPWGEVRATGPGLRDQKSSSSARRAAALWGSSTLRINGRRGRRRRSRKRFLRENLSPLS